MRLPNGDRALVDIAKIEGYLLNPQHPRGRRKARVFLAALGLTRADAGALRGWLQRAARELDAELSDADDHGERYIVRGEMTHKGQSAVVRSAWIVLSGEDFPRFVSAFVE